MAAYIRDPKPQVYHLIDPKYKQSRIDLDITPKQWWCLLTLQHPDDPSTPSSFIENGPGFSRKSFDSLRAKMENSHPLDATYFDIDLTRCKVSGHEGRHRVAAADALGIRSIPTSLFLERRAKALKPGDFEARYPATRTHLSTAKGAEHRACFRRLLQKCAIPTPNSAELG